MPTPLETALPDWERLTGKQNRLQATWVGHATYYVQCGGFGFLTDPVWNVRASPVSWAGEYSDGPRGIAYPLWLTLGAPCLGCSTVFLRPGPRHSSGPSH